MGMGMKKENRGGGAPNVTHGAGSPGLGLPFVRAWGCGKGFCDERGK